MKPLFNGLLGLLVAAALFFSVFSYLRYVDRVHVVTVVGRIMPPAGVVFEGCDSSIGNTSGFFPFGAKVKEFVVSTDRIKARLVRPATYSFAVNLRDRDFDYVAYGTTGEIEITDQTPNPLVIDPSKWTWTIRHPVKLGQAAPPISFALTDGTSHALDEYKGKWVLLHFRDGERTPLPGDEGERERRNLAALRSVRDAFAGDSRLAVLTLTNLLHPEEAKVRDASFPLPWMQGYVRSPEVLSARAPFLVPPNIVLVAPDGTLSALGLNDGNLSRILAEKLGSKAQM